jgi:DNA (cytosine-5)-methyltransferase 1
VHLAPHLASRRRIIELFCGAGGFTWGWARTGLTPLASIDHDPVATRTHELNFSDARGLTLNRDLRSFGPAQLAQFIGRRPRDLLAVVGGPPCQGWSKVGRGKMRSLQDRARSLLLDPRNTMYRRFLEFVAFFRPPVVVMENVPGMLSIEGENVANAVVANFAEVGYRATVALVNARSFGVPQDRRRLIFIATRRDLPVRIDANGLEDFAAHFRLGLLNLPYEPTLRQAIADLPPVKHGTTEDPQPYRAPRRLGRYAQIMREGSNGLVVDHVCRGHNKQDLAAFHLMRQGMLYHELPPRLKRYRDDIFRDKYKRLIWNRPSWTVTAHFEKDVYTHIHPGQPRTISVREAARLQSFPDSFRFAGHMGDRFRQVGNAVPPLMAWGIAEYVRGHVELSG